MGSNRFGNYFCVTTWGESHGPAIGCVIDGCPAGIEITVDEINHTLEKRRPGASPYTSPRKESDLAEILSGVFEGKTTGAPISIIIKNRDANSSSYEKSKDICRPGHAQMSYLAKYGIFDYRGGGRASARETACRVAASVIAQKIVPGISIKAELENQKEIEKIIPTLNGDSIGGIIKCLIENVPAGLGDPVYEKLEANLAKAMLSIPASKGFEIGEGFNAATMRGSEHNDAFISQTKMATNHAGGTLGGISTGAPIEFRVAFKPTSSIKIPQETVSLSGEKIMHAVPENGRHDPCVAIRATPVVKAMAALVLADAYLACKVSKSIASEMIFDSSSQS
ncbi:MAG: chorismate synthase [Simkaniaceae bacterium]|nr:chorismate synthase [Simkaniaceae bacterium]